MQKDYRPWEEYMGKVTNKAQRKKVEDMIEYKEKRCANLSEELRSIRCQLIALRKKLK